MNSSAQIYGSQYYEFLLIMPQKCCFFSSNQLFCNFCLELSTFQALFIHSALYSISQHFSALFNILSLFQHYLGLLRKLYFYFQHFSMVVNNFTTFDTQQSFYAIIITFRSFSTFPIFFFGTLTLFRPLQNSCCLQKFQHFSHCRIF